jgi:hypothetical protein
MASYQAAPSPVPPASGEPSAPPPPIEKMDLIPGYETVIGQCERYTSIRKTQMYIVYSLSQRVNAATS